MTKEVVIGVATRKTINKETTGEKVQKARSPKVDTGEDTRREEDMTDLISQEVNTEVAKVAIEKVATEVVKEVTEEAIEGIEVTEKEAIEVAKEEIEKVDIEATIAEAVIKEVSIKIGKK